MATPDKGSDPIGRNGEPTRITSNSSHDGDASVGNHDSKAPRDSTGLHAESETPLANNEQAESGVAKVQAFNKVLYQSGRTGKILLWLLGVSIGLTMFAYALDQGITFGIFTTMATSTFGRHSSLAAVQTASQIMRAISKPFIGKMADITSRPTTYVIVLGFYVVGFVVAASASSFTAYTVGMCFTAVGKSGLDLLSDIIVGDLTPLEWRGFFGGILSLPFAVTVPVNGFIAEGFVDDWRWGLGMFAILIPALLLPAISTLYYMQHRGKKMGMVTMAASKRLRVGEGDDTEPSGPSYWVKLLYQGLIDIDIIGLIILGISFSIILLPFSLAEDASGGWSDPSIIAMLVMGFVLLIVFVLFEVYLSPKPLMTKRILNNRTFLAAVTIYTSSQMASSIRNTYFSSYIYIIKEWSTYEWTIFLGITTMGLSIVSPIAGLIQRMTHRYKSLMIFGAAMRILSYGLLIRTDGTMTQDTGRLIASQLIFCLSSFSVVGVRVGSQASVPHEDMASIISLLSLWSTLGSSIGAAVAAAIWTNEMFRNMINEMPGVDRDTITELYGNIRELRTSYEFNDPARQGAIRAYTNVNGHIVTTAICLAVVPLLASFFMPNFYLGKQQNAVNNKGLDGEVVDVPEQSSYNRDEVSTTGKPLPFYRRVLAAYYK